MKIIDRRRSLQAILALCLISLTSCGPRSPQKLSDDLLDALNRNDVTRIHAVLKGGADPYTPGTSGAIPIREAARAHMREKLSKTKPGAEKSPFEIMAYHARQGTGKKATVEGPLAVHFKMVRQDVLVPRLSITTPDGKYDLAIGGLETELKGIERKGNLFTIKVGQTHRATGTLDGNLLEADVLEYIGGGSSSGATMELPFGGAAVTLQRETVEVPGEDYLPSSKKVVDALFGL